MSRLLTADALPQCDRPQQLVLQVLQLLPLPLLIVEASVEWRRTKKWRWMMHCLRLRTIAAALVTNCNLLTTRRLIVNT